MPPNYWKGRYTEDSYGRREYLGYRVSHTTEMIRLIQTRTPGFVIPDFATVMILKPGQRTGRYHHHRRRHQRRQR